MPEDNALARISRYKYNPELAWPALHQELQDQRDSIENGTGGGGNTSNGKSSFTPTYLLDIHQDMNVSPDDVTDTPIVAVEGSVDVPDGDNVGYNSITRTPYGGLYINQFYKWQLDADPYTEGDVPNIIPWDDVNGQPVGYAESLYIPETPLDLSEATVIEGAITIVPIPSNMNTLLPQAESAYQVDIYFNWFQSGDPINGYYLGNDSDHLGFTIGINDIGLATLRQNFGNADYNLGDGTLHPNLDNEHTISFRLEVGAKLTLYLDGTSFSQETRPSRLPGIAEMKYLFNTTSFMVPDPDQGNVTWDETSGQYIADNYYFGFGLKDARIRAY